MCRAGHEALPLDGEMLVPLAFADEMDLMAGVPWVDEHGCPKPRVLVPYWLDSKQAIWTRSTHGSRVGKVASSATKLIEVFAMAMLLNDRKWSRMRLRVGLAIGNALAEIFDAQFLSGPSDQHARFWKGKDCLIQEGDIYNGGPDKTVLWTSSVHAVAIALDGIHSMGVPVELLVPNSRPIIRALPSGPQYSRRYMMRRRSLAAMNHGQTRAQVWVAELNRSQTNLQQVVYHGPDAIMTTRLQARGAEEARIVTDLYMSASAHLEKVFSGNVVEWSRRRQVIRDPRDTMSSSELETTLRRAGLPVWPALLELERLVGGLRVMRSAAGLGRQRFGVAHDLREGRLHGAELLKIGEDAEGEALKMDATGTIYSDSAIGCYPIASSVRILFERFGVGYEHPLYLHLLEGRTFHLHFTSPIARSLAGALALSESQEISDTLQFFAENEALRIWQPPRPDGVYLEETYPPCAVESTSLSAVVDAIRHATLIDPTAGFSLFSKHEIQREYLTMDEAPALRVPVGAEGPYHRVHWLSGETGDMYVVADARGPVVHEWYPANPEEGELIHRLTSDDGCIERVYSSK